MVCLLLGERVDTCNLARIDCNGCYCKETKKINLKKMTTKYLNERRLCVSATK